MADKTFKLRSARREIILFGTLTLMISVILIGLSARMTTGIPTTILNTVATSTLTIAAGGLIYEYFLRESITSETLEWLNLKASVVSSGLREIAVDSAFEWNTYLVEARLFSILVSSPYGWLEQAWPNILEAGGSRQIIATVYLQDPKGTVLSASAEKLGLTTDDLAAQLNAFSEHLQTSWKNAEAGHFPLVAGSRFSLKYFDFVPSHDVVQTNSDAIIRIHSVGKQEPADPVIVLRLNLGTERFPVSWLKRQMQKLEPLPSVWEREVRNAGD